MPARGQELVTFDLAHQLQQAVVDVLMGRPQAWNNIPVKQFILAGGGGRQQ